MEIGAGNTLEKNRFLALVREHQELWEPLSKATEAVEVLKITHPHLPNYNETQLLEELSEIQDSTMENGEINLEDLEQIAGGKGVFDLDTTSGKIIAGIISAIALVAGGLLRF